MNSKKFSSESRQNLQKKIVLYENGNALKNVEDKHASFVTIESFAVRMRATTKDKNERFATGYPGSSRRAFNVEYWFFTLHRSLLELYTVISFFVNEFFGDRSRVV